MKEINEHSPIEVKRENKENKEGEKKEIDKGNDEEVVVYLIGNKIDLINNGEKEIKEKEKEDLANELGVKYYDISCKWNLNIEEVMARIILDCYQSKRHNTIKKNLQLKRVSSSNKRRNGCC